MPYFTADDDLVSPARDSAAGPLPTIVHCASIEDEYEFVKNQANRFARTQGVGILCNDASQIAEVNA